MKQGTKQAYIELINKTTEDKGFQESFRSFIETYDGTNEGELSMLILSLMGTLLKVNDLDAKALGYDLLLQDQKEYRDDLNEIKDEFEKIQKDEFPENPPVD